MRSPRKWRLLEPLDFGRSCSVRLGPLAASAGATWVWVRLCGYGISVRKSSAFPPLFSERVGKRKVYGRGIGLAIELLKPTPFD